MTSIDPALSDFADWECECGEEFVYKVNLERHAVVAGHRPYRCYRGSCTSAFKQLKELNHHISKVH